MNKFETSQCPLCGQILQLRRVSGVAIFSCPTVASTHSTHYEVETDNRNCIQHIYIGEWSIDNFENASRSRIYKQTPSSDGINKRWKLVKEVPLIKPDTEQNLLDRLERLMLFL